MIIIVTRTKHFNALCLHTQEYYILCLHVLEEQCDNISSANVHLSYIFLCTFIFHNMKLLIKKFIMSEV